MPEEYENAIEFLDGQKTATVTLHSQKQKTAVLKLAKAHPEKVKVQFTPEENGGFLIAHLPVSWIQFRPPRVLTEKQREAGLIKAAKMNAVNAARKRGE